MIRPRASETSESMSSSATRVSWVAMPSRWMEQPLRFRKRGHCHRRPRHRAAGCGFAGGGLTDQRDRVRFDRAPSAPRDRRRPARSAASWPRPSLAWAARSPSLEMIRTSCPMRPDAGRLLAGALRAGRCARSGWADQSSAGGSETRGQETPALARAAAGKNWRWTRSCSASAGPQRGRPRPGAGRRVAHDPRAGVKVDDRLRTTNPRIYAAGDVCLRHKLTHMADASARIVLQNALFPGRGGSAP